MYFWKWRSLLSWGVRVRRGGEEKLGSKYQLKHGVKKKLVRLSLSNVAEKRDQCFRW